MSRMFSSTARVWARMSSTVRPLASRCAPAMESSARRALVPDTKMKSPARRKCGKVPRGRALPATTALSARAAARPASSALMRAIPPPAPLELHADVHGLGEEAERSEEHTSELQSLTNLVCRLLLEKKKTQNN